MHPKFDPNWGPDHDSTFHVTETPAVTTWLSLTSFCLLPLDVIIITIREQQSQPSGAAVNKLRLMGR